MLEMLQEYLIEMTQKPFYNRPGYANDKLKDVVKNVLNNDYYECVHIINDVIKYTESNGMYRASSLANMNDEFRELSKLVSNIFTALMDDPCIFKMYDEAM